MEFLSRDHKIYILDPNAEAAITIDSGDELMVETWDAFEGGRDPEILEAKSLKGPATGPICVNGAEPGDALKVEFIKITLAITGYRLFMNGWRAVIVRITA